jgi:hypothetical protein
MGCMHLTRPTTCRPRHDGLVLAPVPVVDVTGRHARRGTSATRWGLRLLACGILAGILTGTAFAGTLAAVL